MPLVACRRLGLVLALGLRLGSWLGFGLGLGIQSGLGLGLGIRSGLGLGLGLGLGMLSGLGLGLGLGFRVRVRVTDRHAQQPLDLEPDVVVVQGGVVKQLGGVELPILLVPPRSGLGLGSGLG